MTTLLQITAGPAQALSLGESPQLQRCRVGLRHYRRALAPLVPSGSAVVGALDIYLEGRLRDDVLRMLFGLSVLRCATVDQLDSALAARNVAISQRAPSPSITSATILL